MSASLLIVLVLTLAFVLSHAVTRRRGVSLTLTGTEFAVLGFFIGPNFVFDFVSQKTLDSVEPLFSTLIGLLGFTLGFREQPARRHLENIIVGYASAAFVLLSVALAVIPALQWAVPIDERLDAFVVHFEVFRWDDYFAAIHFASTHLWVALGIGAAAAIASPLAIEGLLGESLARGRIALLIDDCARASQNLAIFVLGFVFATARATSATSVIPLTIVEWALAASALGIVSGLLFSLFLGKESQPAKIVLATIGLVTFTAGTAAALGLSPIFVSLLAALTAASTSNHAAAIREQVTRLQHPLFVLVAVFAGMLWAPSSPSVWIFPILYVVVRYVARTFWTRSFDKLLLEPPTALPNIGHALLSQGALSAAIAINFSQRFPAFSAILLTTILCGSLLFDLIAGRWLRVVLVDAREYSLVEHTTSSEAEES
jgi:hypothetical protein